jgi:hypothetical protein
VAPIWSVDFRQRANQSINRLERHVQSLPGDRRPVRAAVGTAPSRSSLACRAQQILDTNVGTANSQTAEHPLRSIHGKAIGVPVEDFLSVGVTTSKTALRRGGAAWLSPGFADARPGYVAEQGERWPHCWAASHLFPIARVYKSRQ